MAISEVPAKFVATCDGCGAMVEQTTKSRPRYWVELHLLRDAYDWQGCAVADGSVKRLLCGDCAKAAETAINAAIAGRYASAIEARQGGDGEAGSVHESAAPKADAQPSSEPTP